MSASIQVSDLKYDTNNGTISSVGIIIDSQSFSIVFKDHKYIVTNRGKSLVNSNANPIAPDKNLVVRPVADTKGEVKSVTPVVDNIKANTPVGANTTPFKNNDELIGILKDKVFN